MTAGHDRTDGVGRLRKGLAGAVAASALLAAALLTGCGSSHRSDSAAFCRHFTAAAAVGGSLRDVEAVPIDRFKQQVTAATTEVRAARTVAPHAISDDVSSLAQALESFRTDVSNAPNRAALDDAVASYRNRTATLGQQSARVDAWVSGHCGVTPVSAGS